MILAVDIGNTTVAMGLVDDGNVIMSEKVMTDISEIEIDYRVQIRNILKNHSIEKLDGAVISSVVPLLTDIISEAVYAEYSVKALVVSYKTSAGLKIMIDEPEKLGSDRIADAVGAVHEYGAPVILIDMGTATTFSVIGKNGEFLGGMIMPGVRTALSSLIKNAALLPQIKLSSPPEKLIGKNTADCIESGVVYGTAACIDGVCGRLSEELGYKPKIIATGGNAGKIVSYCRSEIIQDKYLIFKGLYRISKYYEGNKNA